MKHLALLFALFFVVGCSDNSDQLDDIFKVYSLEMFDINNDGELSQAEKDVVTEINVTGKDIHSLKGIEQFKNLKNLYCDYNRLTSLDLSQNTRLRMLSCQGNQLTNLDLSANTRLETLDCSDNQLTTLDLHQNTKLSFLLCYRNKLTTLDISKNRRIHSLSVHMEGLLETLYVWKGFNKNRLNLEYSYIEDNTQIIIK